MAFELATLQIQLISHFPYFSMIAGPLTDIEAGDELVTSAKEKKKILRCGTNGKTIVFNPDFMGGLSQREQNFHACNMVLAVARRQHLLRMGRDKDIWSLACGIVRASELTAWHTELVEKKIRPRFDIPADITVPPGFSGLSEHEVYDKLVESGMKPKANQGGNGQQSPYGELVDAAGMSEGMSPADRRDLINRESDRILSSLRAAEARANRAGDGSNFWSNLADSASDVGPDPEALLAKFVTNAFPTGRSWKTPDTRAWAMGQYYPGEVKDCVGELSINIDCSGSMCRETVAECLRWVENAVAACQPERVHVIYFTGEVERHSTFEHGEPFTIPEEIPNGGTCFAKVRKYLDDQGISPACEIWMTDGYDGFPEPPPHPVMFIMTTDVQPPYGEVVRFEVEE